MLISELLFYCLVLEKEGARVRGRELDCTGRKQLISTKGQSVSAPSCSGSSSNSCTQIVTVRVGETVGGSTSLFVIPVLVLKPRRIYIKTTAE